MLDLKLPDVTGLSGFLRLRERIPDVPVLVISALTSVEVVQALMAAGAAGFIPKDAATNDLKTALIEIRSGRRYIRRDIEMPARRPGQRRACPQCRRSASGLRN
ncbi:response regulator [Rhodovulum sp.]|uniref:response regulator n=1 Tax=Rhodovulum sp. TaxID=34009 RepID=UPI00257BE08D|nr:response regulator [Rhodovulum sp.]